MVGGRGSVNAGFGAQPLLIRSRPGSGRGQAEVTANAQADDASGSSDNTGAGHCDGDGSTWGARTTRAADASEHQGHCRRCHSCLRKSRADASRSICVRTPDPAFAVAAAVAAAVVLAATAAMPPRHPTGGVPRRRPPCSTPYIMPSCTRRRRCCQRHRPRSGQLDARTHALAYPTCATR